MPVTESGGAVVGRVELVEHGYDRLARSLLPAAWVSRLVNVRGQLAAVRGQAAQVVLSLRDAEAEPDRQRPDVPCDSE
jgi:hypothetical protein